MMRYTYDAERFRNVFEREFTYIGGFLRNVRRFGSKLALVDPQYGKKWSYAELDADVNRLANALQRAGVGVGDLTLYLLCNSPEFVFCYLAPQKLGAVNCPLNFNLSAGEIARVVDAHRPKVFVYDVRFAKSAPAALQKCQYKPSVILVVDDGNTALPEGHRSFRDFLRSGSPEPSVMNAQSDMYAEVTRLFTSGTTSTPKGVPLNNVNEVLSAHDVIMHYPLTSRDVTMNMTPWFHRGGLHSGGPSATLYAGAALVCMRMFSARTCLEYVQTYGITFLTGVPAALEKLAQWQQRHPSDLSHLRGIVTMGSPLEKEACLRYQEILTPNIFNGYGTTETFWNSFLRPWQLPEMAGTAGQSCTDDEVRMVRLYEDRRANPEDLVPTDSATPGEVIISACCKSALSYAKDPEQTEERFRDGWFYTGDVGTWDDQHFITIHGRKDDMIISMGENIYPPQLEEIINRHPLVADCMIIGVPDSSRGEAVAAYVIPSSCELTAQTLHIWCVQNEDIAAYMRPRWYRFVNELPYNATGKKQHAKLKAMAKDDLREARLIRP